MDDTNGSGPGHVAQTGPGALDLARTGTAAELEDGLVDLGQAGGAPGVPSGGEPAIGVERDAAAEPRLAGGDELVRLTVATAAERS